MGEFVVGLPRSYSGEETPQSNKVRSIAGRLAVRAAERYKWLPNLHLIIFTECFILISYYITLYHIVRIWVGFVRALLANVPLNDG